MPTRKAVIPGWISSARTASMGPRRCRRGRPTRRPSSPSRASASMGPRRCRRGRASAAFSVFSMKSSFNGAASLPTRKAARVRPRPSPRARLQWGRVVADAEGLLAWRRWAANAVLQWGRVVADAEGTALRRIRRLAVASMGPRRCRRGRSAFPSATSSMRSRLQWGRVVADAEGPTRRGGPRRVEPASMGPRRCRRGRRRPDSRRPRRSPLQWGRVVADAEGPRCDRRRRARNAHASMGPRRCRRGRFTRDRHRIPVATSFNGAASLPTRKGTSVT